jgi:hypothetical protein
MSSSTARNKMSKPRKTKKVSEPVIAKFLVKFNNNPNMFTMKVFNLNKCVPRIERWLKGTGDTWKYALLKDQAGMILSYYHPSNGTNAIDKETYTKLFKKESFTLYIIPSKAYKRANDNPKPVSKRVYSLDDVSAFYKKEDVLRIDVYQKGKVINSFNGQFKKKR